MNHIVDGFTANLGPVLLQLWPLWAFFGGISLWQILLGRRAQRRLARAGMPAIDRMSGPEFERRLGVLFHALGYAVEHTGWPGDFGADAPPDPSLLTPRSPRPWPLPMAGPPTWLTANS